MYSDYFVLIPAYKPDGKMLPFLKELQSHVDNILVVDDGSGDEYAHIFDEVQKMGIPLLRHGVNMGKGRALKTGLNEIMVKFPSCQGVVTADCDGQHRVKDILRTLDALIQHPDKLIVGARGFGKETPIRSQIGNTITRHLFTLATGLKIHDTQTGLRGLPKSMFDKLVIQKGERYEYEMNTLLFLREWGIEPYEIRIDTVYFDNNKGSHYSTLRDSFRIALQFFKFMFSSLTCYIFEYALSLLLHSPVFALSEPVAYFVPRAFSSVINFAINKHLVFKGNKDKFAIVKYYMLVLCSVSLGSLFVNLLEKVMPFAVAKPLTDSVLFILNYIVQRNFVFKSYKESTEKK